MIFDIETMKKTMMEYEVGTEMCQNLVLTETKVSNAVVLNRDSTSAVQLGVSFFHHF